MLFGYSARRRRQPGTSALLRSGRKQVQRTLHFGWLLGGGLAAARALTVAMATAF